MSRPFQTWSRTWLPPATAFAILSFAVSGCATAPAAVSPSEIPELERRLYADPMDVEARLRYSAALFAAGDCELARPSAGEALRLRPGNEVGTLVIGQCLEQEERYEEAVSTYRRFLEAYPDARGADAVRAREAIATRGRARALARRALAREDSLAAETDDDAMGVLPFTVSGDEELSPLSLGLAHIITTDLALIERFRLVERVSLTAVMEELELARSDRVDPATAARVGRLLGAGRLMQGSLVAGTGAPVDLSAAVALSTGEVVEPSGQSGDLESLLRLEKQLVLDIIGNLGYVLSEAERQRILENGTQNLVAFLAFSRGLEAEGRGDYRAAVQHYADAARADPGFGEARERQRTVAAVEVVVGSEPADITTVAEEVAAVTDAVATGEQGGSPPTGSLISNALASSVVDVAGTQAERTTQGDDEAGGAGQQRIDDVNRPEAPPLPRLVAIIRVVVRIP